MNEKINSSPQSVEGGVTLPPVEESDAYASFLAEGIMTHLDQEWMPQECHREIGLEAAKVYLQIVQKGTTHLSDLVLELGTHLESFDMGEAFVGPWDIANLVSDFIMAKMGAETSLCSTRIPDTIEARGSSSSKSVTTETRSTFELFSADVKRMDRKLRSEFSRYRFLMEFIDEAIEWSDMNVVMAMYQGYTPDGGNDNVRTVWRERFPGAMPPRLEVAEGVVEALEADFPEDPEELEGLGVIISSIYGEEGKEQGEGDPENGIPADEKYMKRATVCKWLYLMGYIHQEISRAPDVAPNIRDEPIIVDGK
ncbi:unnamed protein product [Choristocarpus tenellus]